MNGRVVTEAEAPSWVALYESGMSIEQVALEASRSRMTVARWIHRLGVQIRPASRQGLGNTPYVPDARRSSWQTGSRGSSRPSEGVAWSRPSEEGATVSGEDRLLTDRRGTVPDFQLGYDDAGLVETVCTRCSQEFWIALEDWVSSLPGRNRPCPYCFKVSRIPDDA